MTTQASDYRLGYGAGRTNENVSIWGGSERAGKVPIIMCHGFLGTATQWYDTPNQTTLVGRAVSAAGLVGLGPDLGLGDNGLNSWGRDDVVEVGGAIDDAVAYSAAQFGTRTDKVGIYGTSMGGCAVGWCWRNPDKVAAAAFTIPCLALKRLHDRNPIGLGPFIELAYTNLAGLEAAYSTHDPIHPDNVVKIIPIADKIHAWYSTDDNVIAAAEVEDFAAATGVEVTAVGAFGHSVAWSQQPVMDWLIPRLWWA